MKIDSVLLGMQQRGFTRPAKLAVGDGALGFWSALSEVYPQTRSQRCWMHKSGNVLNYLPKVEAHRWRDALAKAKQGLQEIWMAETRARPRAPSTTGSNATRTSTPRPPHAWRAIARKCWPSTTSPLSTGRTCARPT